MAGFHYDKTAGLYPCTEKYHREKGSWDSLPEDVKAKIRKADAWSAEWQRTVPREHFIAVLGEDYDKGPSIEELREMYAPPSMKKNKKP